MSISGPGFSGFWYTHFWPVWDPELSEVLVLIRFLVIFMIFSVNIPARVSRSGGGGGGEGGSG